jgi:hypothetical protein
MLAEAVAADRADVIDALQRAHDREAELVRCLRRALAEPR